MKEAKVIEKYRPDPEGLDFVGLKQEGLELLQELCGKSWTDYNLHDPGVTILEQLCYALTDLIYRTEYPIPDHLTQENGEILYSRQALYAPASIFPSQPLTCNDYRKIIFDSVLDQVSGVEDIWVISDACQDDSASGLLRIFLRLKEYDQQHSQQAVTAVTECYAAHRNLCEDLEAVNVIKNLGYTLQGTVEIDSTREPNELLAELYFQCAKFISPGIVFYPFAEMLEQGMSFEQLFTGPLTKRGYIKDSELEQQRQSITIADLIGLISEIEGVQYIDQLWFEDNERRKLQDVQYDTALNFYPVLLFPRNKQQVGIKLLKNGREHWVSLDATRVEFDKLNAEYRGLRQTQQDLAAVAVLPAGNFNNLAEYYSVQNQFPAVYGINHYGVPDSSPPRRKAQARQLKAYLMFFEQLMANFQATLQQVDHLFSVDDQAEKTCFYQLLNNNNVPNIEDIYQADLQEVDTEIARIIKQYDKYIERRNKILDYLLGIYGEEFKQNSLRRFNYYYSEEKLEHKIIANKLSFLKDIVDISRGRAGAFNYRQKARGPHNVSCLEKKLLLLLGMHNHGCNSLSGIYSEHRQQLVENQHFKSLFHGETDKALSAEMLHDGINVESYCIQKIEAKQPWQLLFKSAANGQSDYKNSYANEQQAVLAASDLHKAFVRLNLESEGLHLLEHILLRPAGALKYKQIEVPDSFYAFKISVVFSGWTVRCNDREFRKLAEETVALNCPAHIFPEFYWLGFEQMCEFEELYKHWLKCKSAAEVNLGECNTAAQRLITLLLNYSEGTG